MAQESRKTYEFDGFRLDAHDLLLFREEERLTLRPKVVETLLALVEHNGQVVHKDELMNIVWPGTSVEEGNLAQNMYLLRKTLGTSPDGTPYVETLHRRGYRFSATVNTVDSPTEEPDVLETPVSNSRRRTLLLVVGVIILLAGTAAFFLRSNGFSAAAPGEMSFLRLTNGGDINDATISPDGKYFIYHEIDGNISHLWMQQTGSASRIEVIPPPTRTLFSKTFSPDGQNIYFIAAETLSSPTSSLYRVPLIGGVETKIVDDTASTIAVSPDGRQLAFLRNYPERNITDLILSDSDGGSQRTLMTSPENHQIWGGLAWSPDGRSIAYGEVDRTDPGHSGACTLDSIDPENGATRALVGYLRPDGLDGGQSRSDVDRHKGKGRAHDAARPALLPHARDRQEPAPDHRRQPQPDLKPGRYK